MNSLRIRFTARYLLHSIKVFAKLAYLGLLYHQLSLTTDEERASFREYRIAGVREHITSAPDRAIVENVVNLLPPQSLSALASLVQHLSLEKAQMLMMSKSQEVQNEVLDVIRPRENKGPWAEERIQRENSEYTRQLIEAGITILRRRMEEQSGPMQDQGGDFDLG